MAEGTEKQKVIEQLIADGYEQIADIELSGIKIYRGAKKSRERTVMAYLRVSADVLDGWWSLRVLFVNHAHGEKEKVYVVKRDINPAQVSSVTWMEKDDEGA